MGWMPSNLPRHIRAIWMVENLSRELEAVAHQLRSNISRLPSNVRTAVTEEIEAKFTRLLFQHEECDHAE